MTNQSAKEYITWMRRGHILKLLLTTAAFASCALEFYGTIVLLGALLILLILETGNISRQCGKIDTWLKD